jgi:hypothetical protein
MALATELAVEAIELESFVEEIPDLQAHFDKLQTRLEKGGKKIQCSFNTNRGGTSRAPFWAGTRVQGGAGIQQFGLGTSAPIGGDTSSAPYVPAWGRGTGSQFVSMCASPIRFVNVCEISNLAQYATDGKERGLVKFSREEMDKSLLAFDNGVEAVLNRDGSGTIDQIPLSATITTGGSGAQTSIIAGINTAASFVDQQQVQFLSAVGGTLRGGAGATATISYVDPVTQTLFFSTSLPSGTAVGDIIVVNGATGSAGSSVYGKDYWIQNGNIGTFGGVNIATYPSRFSSPTINFGGTGTIVNSTAQRVQSIRMRAMGDDYDKNEKCFWYANPQQGVALAGNYYVPGYTRLDEGGNERVPDVAKKQMQDTWAGDEVVWSSTAEPSRMDRIVPDAFYFGELFPTRLHEWTPGNPIAAVPTNDGSGASNAIGTTYYDSTMFAYERAFNLLCPEMRQQFFFQGLPVPADS